MVRSVRYQRQEENALERTSRYLNVGKAELVARREAAGYTHSVFLITHGEEKYIYKEYAEDIDNVQRAREMRWQRFFGFPETLHSEELYRIDKYVENANLSEEERVEESTLGKIAWRLGEMHQCRFAEEEKNTYLETLHMFREGVAAHVGTEHNRALDKIDRRINDLLEKSLFRGKEVICHNDLQIGNIMKVGTEIKFIDYEYTSLNIPTIDIANFFCEVMVDYGKGGIFCEERRVGSALQTFFLRKYVQARAIDMDLEELRREVVEMEVVPHYFWLLCALEKMVQKKELADLLCYTDFSLSRIAFMQRRGIISEEECAFLMDLVRP
jgi:thiamine kinase-like enzyme